MTQQNEAQEREWIRRARNGDADAFAQLVTVHQRAVYRVAMRIVGNRQEAEDVAQEVFLKAYEALDRFDLARPLAPWLYRIARNTSLTWIKQRPPHFTLGDWVQDESGPGPEAQAVTKERLEQLRQALAALPEHYRRAIELRHFQGLSYKEIGDALGVPLSDVKSWLFRARRRLRASVGKPCEAYYRETVKYPPVH